MSSQKPVSELLKGLEGNRWLPAYSHVRVAEPSCFAVRNTPLTSADVSLPVLDDAANALGHEQFMPGSNDGSRRER